MLVPPLLNMAQLNSSQHLQLSLPAIMIIDATAGLLDTIAGTANHRSI